MKRPLCHSLNTFMLLVLMSCLVAPAHAKVDNRTLLQRQMYLDAEKAIEAGQLTQYHELKKRLRDYPLYPYLKYHEITRNINSANDQDVHRFLQQNAGTPLASRLQYAWLKSLARKQKWQTLIDNYYYTSNVALQCDYAKALISKNQRTRAYAVMEGVWLTGRSLPKNCDAPIKSWHASGKLSQQLVWERIRLAMQSRRTRLALFLSDYLDEDDRFWVRMWAKVKRQPEYVLQVYDRFEGKDSQPLRWVIGDGIRRMARHDAPAAAQLWHTWRDKFNFSKLEKDRIERRLALSLVKEDPASGQKWLSQLDLKTSSKRVNEVYVLTAFQDQDWDAAIDWLDRLDDREKHSERWRYWRGRALEAMGRLDEARSVYLLNADSRGYYGFLSADRAGMNYQLEHRPVVLSRKDLTKVSRIPAIERARELHAINRLVDARREWHHALKTLDKPQLLSAAQLAHEWDWHDRAIITLAQAKYWDDLEKRFPLAHRELVINHAHKQHINPAWAFAIIRQESAFTRDARSHAGAMGLMQLLPRTARQVARSLSIRFHHNDLLNADTNVQLGINYLRHVMDKFKGNKVLATAAYNAGDHRVSQWLPQNDIVPADVWVEGVPFKETRKYLKRVLTYTVIYEQRLGKQPVPLLERMLPIPGKVTILSSGNDDDNNDA
jgi:soluble lytic murein transglycosylase